MAGSKLRDHQLAAFGPEFPTDGGGDLVGVVVRVAAGLPVQVADRQMAQPKVL
jgi:hypothetical protein